MFTGIVEEVGRVVDMVRADGHAELTIRADRVLGDAQLGDSIAVDGCCLTVAHRDEATFTSQLMSETLRATTLGRLRTADGVHLERAVAADGRFGGHLVQGHVDGVGRVVERREQPGTVSLRIEPPDEVRPFLVPKGSIAIAGVSLTVVACDSTSFTVGLIPHTCAVTLLGELDQGHVVNLEADIIAKYAGALLAADTDTPYRQNTDGTASTTG